MQLTYLRHIASFLCHLPWHALSLELGPRPFSVCTGSVFFQPEKVSPGKVSPQIFGPIQNTTRHCATHLDIAQQCKILLFQEDSQQFRTIQGGAVTFACKSPWQDWQDWYISITNCYLYRRKSSDPLPIYPYNVKIEKIHLVLTPSLAARLFLVQPRSLNRQQSFLIIQAHARPPAIDHCQEG